MVCLLQGLKLQIYRLRRPELLSWVPLIPLQKLPVRFSPEGLRKYPISWGFFFLTYYSRFCIFNPSQSKFLSFIYHYHSLRSPSDFATLPSGTPPAFRFGAHCNTKFKLEISSISNFSETSQIKSFNRSSIRSIIIVLKAHHKGRQGGSTLWLIFLRKETQNDRNPHEEDMGSRSK